MAKLKKLTPEQIKRIEAEVLLLLLAERDCYATWVRSGDLKTMPSGFETSAMRLGGYHAEAFGIFRALRLLRYRNPGYNGDLQDWFNDLMKKALAEEERLGGPVAAHRHYSAKFTEKYGKD